MLTGFQCYDHDQASVEMCLTIVALQAQASGTHRVLGKAKWAAALRFCSLHPKREVRIQFLLVCLGIEYFDLHDAVWCIHSQS